MFNTKLEENKRRPWDIHTSNPRAGIQCVKRSQFSSELRRILAFQTLKHRKGEGFESTLETKKGRKLKLLALQNLRIVSVLNTTPQKNDCFESKLPMGRAFKSKLQTHNSQDLVSLHETSNRKKMKEGLKRALQKNDFHRISFLKILIYRIKRF